MAAAGVDLNLDAEDDEVVCGSMASILAVAFSASDVFSASLESLALDSDDGDVFSFALTIHP